MNLNNMGCIYEYRGKGYTKGRVNIKIDSDEFSFTW